MEHLDAKTILAVLGPVFLLLAAWRTVQARALVPQARTWWIVGGVFSLVALWLWFGQRA
jgi:hypothetical protein